MEFKRFWSNVNSDLPNRQLEIHREQMTLVPMRDLPNRQLEIFEIIGYTNQISDLPHRQLKLGQEVNNHIV